MGNKQSQPRRNADDYYNNLQYTTPRGNVPTQVLTHHLANAPPVGTKTRSKYPREYFNREGEHNKPNFQPWETRKAELHEYPVKEHAHDEPFRFDRKCASARQVERPIHPGDRKDIIRKPRNDPGVIRGVVDQNGKMVGVNAHPAGNARGFQRARMEPLDRQGRQEVKRYQDRFVSTTAPTWPQR